MVSKLYSVSKVASGYLSEPEICVSLSGAIKAMESQIPISMMRDYKEKTSNINNMSGIVASKIKRHEPFTIKVNDSKDYLVFRIDQHKIKIGVSK